MTDTGIELLAPAGSVTGLKAVIEAGADAVYIGGTRFGARAYAENPDESDLVSAIDYAHMRNVRVYLTVNTLLKNNELDELKDYIEPYYLHGIDAVLVQDFGVLKVLHESFPDLPLHASTQMTVTGPYSAKLLAEYGVTRIVPARELSLNELREIKEKSGLEVEAFVHGAICVCYSGQCLMSGMIGGRSGNRGRCAQPCRLKYTLSGRTADSNVSGGTISGELLSPKDMCTLDFLPDMIDAGVCSFKIEGRMKQPEYGAGVVSIYRKYIDLYVKSGRASYKVSRRDRQILLTLFNRDGFTDGYLAEHNGRDMMALKRRTLSEQEEKARADLYERLHSEYVAKDTSLIVDGKVTVSAGKLLSLDVTEIRTGKSVTVSGERVQKAENRPLSSERIYGQIMKTGESGYRFRKLEVKTDEISFVPMAQLNALRRQAFAAMNSALLSDHLRSSSHYPDPNDYSPVSDGYKADLRNGKLTYNEADGPKKDCCRISAEIETEEQFRAVLYSDCIRLIYIPYSFICRKGEEEREVLERAAFYLEQASSHGKKLSLSMPYIERNDGIAEIRNFEKDLISMGYHGFLVKSFETLARLLRAGLSHYIRTDSSVYTFNDASRMLLSGFGLTRDTVPVELNKKEILNRKNNGSELIVYGHLPLMITAQCLQKTTAFCTKNHPKLSLTDRKGRIFKVTCDCDFCYNIIRNPVVLSLFSEADFMSKAGISSARLLFTEESAEEVSEVCRISGRALYDRIRIDVSGEHTKGHFNRGVE